VNAVADDADLGDRTSMAYGGTLVSQGTGTGLVVETGAHTEMGRISNLIANATELDTPLTRALLGISKQITLGIGAVTVIMVIVGTIRSVNAGMSLAEALR
jgi:magnesium-transporting ATPase (P-type)